MISLPSNWLKMVRVREYPHDSAHASLLIQFVNDHGQTINLFQHLQGRHGMTAASQLEDGLAKMAKFDLAHMDPFINATARERIPARDQNWTATPLPNTLNLKDFRAKHNLRDPEEANRA
jgi:hypothetical protein